MNFAQTIRHFILDIKEGQPKAWVSLFLIIIFGFWFIWMTVSITFLII